MTKYVANDVISKTTNIVIVVAAPIQIRLLVSSEKEWNNDNIINYISNR